jgi:release factor glutamine methyltransferase
VTAPPRETTEGLLHEGVERLRAAGSETPRLDAELLLGDAIGLGRTVILAHPEAPVGADATATYRAGIERRAAGEPVAYIRGTKEFYGLALAVDRRALIPRPETERLVELAELAIRERLPGTDAPDERPIRIADVGTGSGAIVVALAVSLRRLGALAAVELVALDSSEEALGLARENAVGHAVADEIRFQQSDLLGPPGEADARRPFDVVLANLPYIRHDVLAGLPVAASFEPAIALDGGSDGLEVIERLLVELPEGLAAGGLALLEIGADHGVAIVERCRRILPDWRCMVEADLSGLPRVAHIARA